MVCFDIYNASILSLMLRIGAAHLNICRNGQTIFRKVRSTEIAFVKGYGATRLKANTH